jgi:hypothetical protein
MIDLIETRFANTSDVPFILATWLKGLRFGNGWFKLIDNKAYFKTYHGVIISLLSRPTVLVSVACLKEDPSVILGYAVVEGNKLHWCQVKKAWRGIGIAKSLVPKEVDTVTHLTDTGKSIFLKKGLIFNPFA